MNEAIRVFPRVAMDIPATYASEFDESLNCVAIDFSACGACLRVDRRFPQETMVSFQLSPRWVVPVQAHKTWERPDGDGWLVGIEHKPVKSSDRQMVGTWVHRMRRERRLGALSDATTDEAAFKAVLQLIVERMKPDRAAVFYGMSSDGLLQARATHNLDRETMYSTEQLSHAILFALVQDRKPQVVVNARFDPRFYSRSSVVLSGIESAIGCPLLDASGNAVGLLYADKLDEVICYRQGHLAWFEELRDELMKRFAPHRPRPVDPSARG